MQRTTVAKLGLVLAHAIVVGALYWPRWALGLVVLPCWGLAVLGAAEPRPTTSARHADVRAAERTRLGRALMVREGWVIERPVLASVLFALVSLGAAAILLALGRQTPTTGSIVRTIAWAPAVLPALGFLLAQMVNIWALSFTVTALWLVFVVAFAVEGEGMMTLRLVGGGLGGVAALFAVDLLRGARRGLERRRRFAEIDRPLG